MNFLKKLLGSNTGISSKRLIGLSACVVIYIIAFVDLFTDKTVTNYVFEGLVYLAIGGVFGIAAERFADVLIQNKQPKSETPIPPKDTNVPPVEQLPD
jgi:hypothetical protein